MDDKEKRFVDELLDASLRHYVSAEPPPGLEGRVLAGVRARLEAARQRAMRTWALGTAVVAAMVTLLVLHWSRQQFAPLPVTAKAPVNLSAPVQPLAPPQPRRHTRQRWVDTRPQQFPTPRPLSEQEELLLVYAQFIKGSSAASTQMAVEDSEHDLEIPPLSIAAITIEPLGSPENGDEK